MADPIVSLGGFDVQLAEAIPVEVAPGVMGVELVGNGDLYDPPFIGDGTGQYLIVPDGVDAITVQMFGAMGGFTSGVPVDDPMYPIAGPGLDAEPNTPIMHTRRFPVTAGQTLAWFAGGPPWLLGQDMATRGHGPLWGTPGLRLETTNLLAGAGGGASALYLDGDLVALGPGGAGAFWFAYDIGWTAPPTDYPTGAAGEESLDPSAWPGGFAGMYGGGGGGAPYGSRGLVGAGDLPPFDGAAALNGSGVPIDADSGGPPSPTWAETPIGDPTYRGAPSAVRIFFYRPAIGGWSIDTIPF